MPPNKKKNKQKKNKGGASPTSSSDNEANLNAQVLESLTRLADTLTQLDEACDHEDVTAGLVEGTAAMRLADTNDVETEALEDDAMDEGNVPSLTLLSANKSTTPTTLLQLSHWRTLPLPLTSAYQILNDGASYIHATSTKYTLVGKVDSTEGGNLAIELRKGAELIGTGTLLLFSPSCGSSRSLRHYVKQSSRAVLASVISLVKSFESGVARGAANDGNNVGAQKTGAVWSACDKLTQRLPKGNRAAMRRELMVWVRDCGESTEEFEEVLEMGPRDDGGDEGEEEGDMMEEDEQYAEKEMKVAKASVNVMKCSKNLLGLVLAACECVGEHADKLSQGESKGQEDDVDSALQKQQNDDKRKEMLQWIGNLHEMARSVGEGVTNCGVLLYPPLDLASANNEELQQWQAKKGNTTIAKTEENNIPSLGSTTLGLQLEQQLYALAECISSVHNASLPMSGESIQSCLSKEVVDAAERLTKAVPVRCKEVEEAIAVWDQDGSS